MYWNLPWNSYTGTTNEMELKPLFCMYIKLHKCVMLILMISLHKRKVLSEKSRSQFSCFSHGAAYEKCDFILMFVVYQNVLCETFHYSVTGHSLGKLDLFSK